MTAHTLVAGRYRLETLAGRGGMGEVWRAVDVETGLPVALKRMLDAEADADRFARESVLLSKVKHDALVAHVGHGVDAGVPWLAMAWVDGETLASRLVREGLPLGDTLVLTRRIAAALSALHAQGIVHRDLKPSNVMLADGRPGAALLLDLGVARTAAATRVLTATNLIVGTIGYMAPEQALSGRDVTASADVFSLGCLLFECLTGAPVYPCETPIGVLAHLLTETPRRVRTVRPEVPAVLDGLVAAMLAREPDKRPRDGAAALAALAALDFTDAALRQTAPHVLPGMTRDEQALALAAVVELGSGDGHAPTVSEQSLTIEMDRVRSVAQSAGCEAIPFDTRTALVIAEGRGTVADRASVIAGVARSIVAALRSARVGLAAGLAKGSARAPAVELLERAAKLARGAPEGTIALDQVTRDLLAPRFEIDERGSLGGARVEDGGRRVMGKVVPFLGREKEMAILEATVAEAIEESAPRALLVLARPGTGKSRLTREFVEARLRRRKDVTTLEARAESASAGTVHAVMRGLVREAIGLGLVTSPDDHASLRTYVRSLPGVEDAERLADFLGDLAGAPRLDEAGVELASARGDAELMSGWMRRTVREWLGAEAARKPVILVIEDLHWSDEATVVHLGEALRTLTDRPFVVIALARPEVQELFREPWRNLAKLELGGLGARAAERIARAVLGSEADRGVIARVVERADGNPYFLEELMRFVAEDRGDELPANVLAVLHARLAELDPELRRALRAASVLGERFTAEGVAAVVGMAIEVQGAIDALIREELLERTDEGGFAFRHALAREATYATLGEADRRAAHERAANWVERQPNPSPRAMMAHLEAAGAIERTIPWVVAAAVQSHEMGGDEEAHRLAEKGLALGASGIEEGWLHALLAGRATFRADWPATVTSGRLAMERLPTTHPQWCYAAGQVLLATSCIGDLAGGAEVIGRWLAGSARPQGPRMAYIAQFTAVTGLVAAGMTDQAKAVLANATPPRPGTAGQAWVECSHAAVAFYQAGRLGNAHALARRARDIALKGGDGLAVAVADMHLCGLEVWCVSSEAGQAELRNVIESNAAAAVPILREWFSIWRAILEARVDQEMSALRRCAVVPSVIAAESARSFLRTQLVRWNDVDKLDAELLAYSPILAFARSNATVCSALVALWRGDPEGALRESAQAEELARVGGFFWTWELLHACRASALIALGRKADALASVRAGLARIEYTLEGLDDELRAGAEIHVDAIKRLRALAKELGVTDASAPVLG